MRNTFQLVNRKSNLFVLFALGSVTSNYLRNQGNYNQYTLKFTLNGETHTALERILSACPRRGQTSPLLGDELKVGVKYEKVFSADERAKHNGPTPYPNISDARWLDCDTPLHSLPSYSASDLVEGSVIAVAFTLTSYTYGTGGISAKLEQVYLIELAKEKLLETPVKRSRIISLSDSADDDDDDDD